MALKLDLIDDITKQQERTGFPLKRILGFYGLKKSTYHSWFDNAGQLRPPKDRPLKNDAILPDEEMAVLVYREKHPDVGYRKLAWMMVDANVAFLTESATYTILSKNNKLWGWKKDQNDPASKEYKNKPKHVHHHWHMDIAYIKIGDNFYFLIMMLDGYSRFMLDWELMPDMLGSSVETFVQRVKDKYPDSRPMLITDNGSQFISLDFKRLVSNLQITHVRSRRNHPETNGKIERLNGTVKHEAIRTVYPQSFQEAFEVLNEYAYTYNYHRLHAGINYLRPADMFFGRGDKILNERRQKIILARQTRIEQNRERKSSLIS
jgi:transposase-like protein